MIALLFRVKRALRTVLFFGKAACFVVWTGVLVLLGRDSVDISEGDEDYGSW